MRARPVLPSSVQLLTVVAVSWLPSRGEGVGAPGSKGATNIDRSNERGAACAKPSPGRDRPLAKDLHHTVSSLSRVRRRHCSRLVHSNSTTDRAPPTTGEEVQSASLGTCACPPHRCHSRLRGGQLAIGGPRSVAMDEVGGQWIEWSSSSVGRTESDCPLASLSSASHPHPGPLVCSSMRKVSVSRPTPAVAGLHLPLDYIAHHLRVPVASLLQVDQKTIELVFPLLLGQLGLTQLGELVAMRADQRMDAQMAPKVGSSANALATQAKALEEEYQSTFKQLVLTQATSLGFKGITNPDLRTLAADKKLTLRLIDHLAKRCFGPPTTAHTTGRDAGSETTARPPPPKRGQAIDATPHPAAGERRATTNHEQLQHREQQQPPRRDAPSSRPSPAPSTREDARAIRPAASQLRQPPSRRHRAAEEEEEEEPVNYEEDEFEGARSPPSDHGLEGEEDEDAPPSPVAPSTFDGRFAEEEFSPLAAAAAAAAAAGSSSRPPHQQQRSAPGSSRGGAPSSRDRLAAGRKKSTVLPDDQLTADELRAELRAERARHHATALQLQSLTGMYEQLLTERGEEKFGARRVTLLKAQNMQQERQLALLSEGIDARRTALAEIATIASGLEHAVSASTSGAPPEPNTHEAATTHKAQKRLAHLEQSLEAARQRVRQTDAMASSCC